MAALNELMVPCPNEEGPCGANENSEFVRRFGPFNEGILISPCSAMMLVFSGFPPAKLELLPLLFRRLFELPFLERFDEADPLVASLKVRRSTLAVLPLELMLEEWRLGGGSQSGFLGDKERSIL